MNGEPNESPAPYIPYLFLYFFLRECEVNLGEEEKERGGSDEDWRMMVEEGIWGWMSWNGDEFDILNTCVDLALLNLQDT